MALHYVVKINSALTKDKQSYSKVIRFLVIEIKCSAELFILNYFFMSNNK